MGRTRIQAAPPASRKGSARGANLIIAFTAAVLLAISLGGYWYHRQQMASIASQQLRLLVTGPSTLQAGVAARYGVSTTAVTGVPLPAQVELALYAPDGQRLWAHKEKSDEFGLLQVTVPGELKVPPSARLEVLAVHRDKLERIDTRLSVEPTRYATQLALDKPFYRAGETVRYRSLTLSQFGLTANCEMRLYYEILGPGGAVVADSQHEDFTRHGVSSGTFQIPAESVGGRYILVARSVDGKFPEERQDFVVHHRHWPRWQQQLEFARDRYAAGDKLSADYLAQQRDGSPAAGLALQITATVDGQQVFEKTTRTDQAGGAHIEFVLPEKIARGVGRLQVVADDDGTRESTAKTIPIEPDNVEVAFYPEGGQLVADLENRVYFVGRTPAGRPVSIKGIVIDSSGRRMTGAEATHAGRGSFSFTPLARQQYRLRISSPAGVNNEPLLPEVSTERKVVLSTGSGVFAADEPLQLNVRAAKANLPLVVAAVCRGALVGQQALVTTLENNGVSPLSIPLGDRVGGVVRVTVYDYSLSPPSPVAERPVYRKTPGLRVRASGQKDRYTPGEKVDLTLAVTDENGQPVAANLSTLLVDHPPPLPTDLRVVTAEGHLPNPHLAPGEGQGVRAGVSTDSLSREQIEHLDDLDATDLHAANDPDARLAIDLLLATQEAPSTTRAAGNGAALSTPPPAVFDNLKQINDNYAESLAAYRADRIQALNTLTAISFVGGLGLMLVVVMLGLLRGLSGARWWLPAAGTTLCCLVIGAILFDSNRRRPSPETAAAFVPFQFFPQSGAAPGNTAKMVGDLPAGADRAAQHDPSNKPPEKPPANRAETLFWRPLVEAPDGRANVSFTLPDAPGTFRVLINAHADGRMDSGSVDLVSRVPFRLAPKVPPELSAGDRVDLPLTVVNESASTLPLVVRFGPGDLLKLTGPAERTLLVPPGKQALEHFALEAVGEKGNCELNFRGSSDRLTTNPLSPSGRAAGSSFPSPSGRGAGSLLPSPAGRGAGGEGASLTSAVTCNLQIVPLGFPKNLSYSGEMEGVQEITVNLPESWEPGSLDVKLNLFPSVVAELQCGLDGMRAEPGGRFQQPAAAADLAAMLLFYLREHDMAPPAIVRSARQLLTEDYQQPKKIETEVRRDAETAETPDDPFQVALAAVAALSAGNNEEGQRWADQLVQWQADDGSLPVTQVPSGRNGGQSSQVEATALAVLAWHKLPGYADQADRAVHWIVEHRQGSGSFGSAQATLLALRALVEHAKTHPTTVNEGKLTVRRDGQLIAQRPFAAGRQEVITIDGLQANLHPGQNRLTLSLGGENQMRYALAVNYHDRTPANDENCPLRLEVKLAAKHSVESANENGQARRQSQFSSDENGTVPLPFQLSGTLLLTAQLTNVTERSQSSAIAILGLPAGLEPRGTQLEELRNTGTIDDYAIAGRGLICYWRTVPPRKKIVLAIDLLATVPGKFTAPPSQIYLSAEPDQKQWAAPLSVEIAK